MVTKSLRLKALEAEIEKLKPLYQQLADSVAKRVYNEIISRITTLSIERSILRFCGLNGVSDEGYPLCNLVVDRLKEEGLLEYGAYLFVGYAVKEGIDLSKIGQKECDRLISNLRRTDNKHFDKLYENARELIYQKLQELKSQRQKRIRFKGSLGPSNHPKRYLIVATGNIYEDVRQAKAAARAGADIIAVIRSTAQSLLDYVPHGITLEGFGGTFATKENFRLMRKALDEVSTEINRYIELVNYSSGLCMPEITVLAIQEGLDILLNDAMYGILFRDINIKRTFADQHFSRMLSSVFGILINTGEDNYLTTQDAETNFHTVLASHFINRGFARLACLDYKLVALGHSFNVNPETEKSILYELAHALLVRQMFPEHPLKYMPPTRFMDGDIFTCNIYDALFNIVCELTGQDIHLLGIFTEAIHNPFMMDRYIAIKNASYIKRAFLGFSDEIILKQDGFIHSHIKDILKNTEKLLYDIEKEGLERAIEKGIFAGISRSASGGNGKEGVIVIDKRYKNPLMEILKEELQDGRE